MKKNFSKMFFVSTAILLIAAFTGCAEAELTGTEETTVSQYRGTSWGSSYDVENNDSSINVTDNGTSVDQNTYWDGLKFDYEFIFNEDYTGTFDTDVFVKYGDNYTDPDGNLTVNVDDGKYEDYDFDFTWTETTNGIKVSVEDYTGNLVRDGDSLYYEFELPDGTVYPLSFSKK